MAQKGKIRELQEDLRISRQTVRELSKHCEKYKKRIKELEEKITIYQYILQGFLQLLI